MSSAGQNEASKDFWAPSERASLRDVASDGSLGLEVEPPQLRKAWTDAPGQPGSIASPSHARGASGFFDQVNVEDIEEEPIEDSQEADSEARSEQPAALANHKRRPRRQPLAAGGGGKPFFQAKMSLPSQLSRRDFVRKPLLMQQGTLRAELRLLRSGGVLSRPRYGLFVSSSTREDILLLAAERQQQGSLGPYYVLSLKDHDFDRASEHFVARLSGNLLCTQYVLHGQRRGSQEKEREELAAIRFRKPGDAPRLMNVVLPAQQESFSSKSGVEGLLVPALDQTVQENGGQRLLWHLTSPVAAWDPDKKAYQMNFHGRVGRSSSKNFQLLLADSNFQALREGVSDGGMCMQFGRQDESRFAFHVSYPLSLVQAFAIALSVFDDRVVESLRLYY